VAQYAQRQPGRVGGDEVGGLVECRQVVEQLVGQFFDDRRELGDPATSLRSRACSRPSVLMMESGEGAMTASSGASAATLAARLNRRSAKTFLLSR
jgi:hypothetical protein